MIHASRTENEPRASAYGAFLSATRPFPVVSIALITYVLAAVFLRQSHATNGWSPASQAFDAAIVVAALAFGWKSRRHWERVIWAEVHPRIVCLCIGVAVSFFLLAAVLQGWLAPTGGSLIDTQKPPFVLLAILGPLSETIVFQGWIQTAMTRVAGAGFAVAFTALAFWAVHLQFNAPLIVAVVALCYIRMRTQSLATVALAHASINMTMFLIR